MDPLDDPVRVAWGRWLGRNPELAQAMKTDPYTKAMMHRLRGMLTAADCAMIDEGLGIEARRRVVAAALYGSVNAEAEAWVREHAEERVTQFLETHSRPIALQFDDSMRDFIERHVGPDAGSNREN